MLNLLLEITSVKSNYTPVKSKISTSPSSSVVLSAETQRFAVTDSHPYAFLFSPTPSEYGSNFKRLETVADAQFLRALPLKFYANCIRQITKSKISDLSEDSHPLRGFNSNDFNLLK